MTAKNDGLRNHGRRWKAGSAGRIDRYVGAAGASERNRPPSEQTIGLIVPIGKSPDDDQERLVHCRLPRSIIKMIDQQVLLAMTKLARATDAFMKYFGIKVKS